VEIYREDIKVPLPLVETYWKHLMSINERLRQQRILHNWRLRDLADQLGTTVTTINRWERGSQQPSLYYRTRLCALFGLSPQKLGLEPSPPTEQAVSQENSDHYHASHESPSKAQLTIWTVPYQRNPHFTGRQEQLDQLERLLLFPEEPQHAVQPISKVALIGLGGIGKTQIAVEYAYRTLIQQRYCHTLWITATSEETILTNFAALAERIPTIVTKGEMDQRKRATAALHWLEQCEQPWLLIFDNLEELSLLSAYLPRRGHGRILLTTRISMVSPLTTPFEVIPMKRQESTHFLLQRAQRLSQASRQEIQIASTIVEALGHFPLAIDQAGAYIEETGCSLQDYLQLYQEHRLALLARRGRQATGYPQSVATIWSLSSQRIEQINPTTTELSHQCLYSSRFHSRSTAEKI
jgi:transcriptional regulator with XRE-family HTH domain